MKNTQRQAKIDKKRWILSEKVNHDVGGTLPICEYCEHCITQTSTPYYNAVPQCSMSYEDRVKHNPCATAENKYYHKRHSNK